MINESFRHIIFSIEKNEYFEYIDTDYCKLFNSDYMKAGSFNSIQELLSCAKKDLSCFTEEEFFKKYKIRKIKITVTTKIDLFSVFNAKLDWYTKYEQEKKKNDEYEKLIPIITGISDSITKIKERSN